MRGRTLGAWSPPSSPPPSGQRGTQCAKERTDAWRHLGSPLQETGQKTLAISIFFILFASNEAKYRMGFCDSILFSIFFVCRS